MSGSRGGEAGMVGETGIGVNLALLSTCLCGDGPADGEVVCRAIDVDAPPRPTSKKLLSLFAFGFSFQVGRVLTELPRPLAV